MAVATAAAFGSGWAEKVASPTKPLITVDHQDRAGGDIDNCRGVIVFGRTPDQLGELPPVGDRDPLWLKFAKREKGISGPPGSNPIRVVVQGSNQKSVVLTRLEIKVVRKPAPSGTWVVDSCGGDVEPRHLEVDLDGNPPRITYRPEESLGDGGPGAKPPDRPITFPYKVSEDDPEVLLISAKSRHCDCHWTGVLHWVADGEKGTTEITDGGKPFRVIGSDNLRSINPPLP